jgi:hypothetical protein
MSISKQILLIAGKQAPAKASTRMKMKKKAKKSQEEEEQGRDQMTDDYRYTGCWGCG